MKFGPLTICRRTFSRFFMPRHIISKTAQPPSKYEKRIIVNITEILKSGAQQNETAKCESMPAFPVDACVGMAYVPYQTWINVYEPSVGFERGTIFEQLDKPFIGERTV